MKERRSRTHPSRFCEVKADRTVPIWRKPRSRLSPTPRPPCCVPWKRPAAWSTMKNCAMRSRKTASAVRLPELPLSKPCLQASVHPSSAQEHCGHSHRHRTHFAHQGRVAQKCRTYRFVERKLRLIEQQSYSPAQFIDELKTMVGDIVYQVLSDNSNRHVTQVAPSSGLPPRPRVPHQPQLPNPRLPKANQPSLANVSSVPAAFVPNAVKVK